MSVDINTRNASKVWAVMAQIWVLPTVILESGPAGVQAGGRSWIEPITNR